MKTYAYMYVDTDHTLPENPSRLPHNPWPRSIYGRDGRVWL
jgi:hypothetical protein